MVISFIGEYILNCIASWS